MKLSEKRKMEIDIGFLILDFETIIFEIFAELKRQRKTLLVISHDLSDTLDNYDRILLLNKQLI